MKNVGIEIVCLCLLAMPLQASEKLLKMKDLPKPVQATIDSLSKGWSVRRVELETEDGAKCYEVETVNGERHRDLRVDLAGVLVELEEQIPMSELPAEVASAVRDRAGKAKILRIESVTEPNAVPFYEVQIQNGKKVSEVKFARDGKPMPAKSKK